MKETMETSPAPSQPLYSTFADVVGIIFSNWTAIKLAVEHGMGGSPATTQRKLTDMIDVVTQTLAAGNADWCDISDLLADTVDAEFSTLLEDNSSDEVANHLCQLYQMFQAGDHPGVAAALNSLPVHTPINTTLLVAQRLPTQHMDSSSDDNDDENNQTSDDGWTVVKRK